MVDLFDAGSCDRIFLIFCYAPMYGVVIAFKDFKPRLEIMGSEWVGLKYFKEFVGSVFFGRTLEKYFDAQWTKSVVWILCAHCICHSLK